MPDPRGRLVDDAIAGPVQAKRYVHVLEIRPKLFGEHPHFEERIAAIKGAGCAGAEDLAALQVGRAEGQTVAAFAGDAANKVTIAGAIHARPPPSIPPQIGGG